MTLVTIGIPTYNVGRFINQTIKSILAQTYSNFELVITDDGSTDNTVEEIKKFNDPRIKLIVDGENRGISYRLNQQINLAKGKYFVRMDGDDLMFPNRVEKEVAYMEQHPDVDVVGTGAVIIDNDNNIIGQRLGKINCSKPEDIFNGETFIHPTVCGKTEFFKKYHYEERLCGVEDKDLWCRGSVDSSYDIIQEPLLFYRDPLKFKLKTYLSRKKKGRKQVVMRWELFGSKTTALKYIVDSLVKSVGAWGLCIMGIESRFIANRNSDVTIALRNRYNSILQQVLNTK